MDGGRRGRRPRVQLGRGEGRRCRLGARHLCGGRVSRGPGRSVSAVLVLQWAARGAGLWRRKKRGRGRSYTLTQRLSCGTIVAEAVGGLTVWVGVFWRLGEGQSPGANVSPPSVSASFERGRDKRENEN